MKKQNKEKNIIEYKNLPENYKYHVYKWKYMIMVLLLIGIVSIFVTRAITIFLLAILISICVGLNMAYKILLGMKNKIVYIEGVCKEVYINPKSKNTGLLQNKRNYITLEEELETGGKFFYKIYLPDPRKIAVKNTIGVYCPESCLYKSAENCISVNMIYGYDIKQVEY